MTIDRQKSGNYRIRQMMDGKMYSVTVPFKPSKKRADELIREKILNTQVNECRELMSFETAGNKYIEAKSNVLSPATIRGYHTILRNLPDDFKQMQLSDINDYELQMLVNDYAKSHTPKSVRNAYGFIRATIRLFYPKSDISATLPQKRHTEPHIPSYDDAMTLLNHSRDTEYFCAIYLAILGLRRSEICALTLDDLDIDNNLHITKALVPSDDGYILKQTTKTDDSYRTIVLPDELADAIRKQGYVFRYQPQAIDQFIRRSLPKLGIEQFSVHRLRHFFCSYAHDLGYSDAQIQKMGGWSASSDVMHRVYRHALNEEEAKKKLADDFSFSPN